MPLWKPRHFAWGWSLLLKPCVESCHYRISEFFLAICCQLGKHLRLRKLLRDRFPGCDRFLDRIFAAVAASFSDSCRPQQDSQLDIVRKTAAFPKLLECFLRLCQFFSTAFAIGEQA